MFAVHSTTARPVPVPDADGLWTVEVRDLNGRTWEYERWDMTQAQADHLASQVRVSGWISQHHWTREVLCLAFDVSLLTLDLED